MTGAGGGGSARPWIVAADGITLAVRLTPKGGRDAIAIFCYGSAILGTLVAAFLVLRV